MQKEDMKITHDKEKRVVTIELPVDFLVFALENKPDDQVKVLDKSAFADEIVDVLQSYQTQNSKETGLTAFEEFLDEIMEEATVVADEGVVELKS